MLTVRTCSAVAVAAMVLLLSNSCVRADYMSLSVPLSSQFAGSNVGSVLLQANNGSTAANGLQPGQVEITYTINPVAAYTHAGADVGFTSVGFNTDLSLISSRVTIPSGWALAMEPIPTSLPGGFTGPFLPAQWTLSAPSGSRSGSVTFLISGLGSSATLNHFSLSYPSIPPLPPTTFTGTVAYPGATTADSVYGTVASTPEPTSLALTLIGAAVAVTRRRKLFRQ